MWHEVLQKLAKLKAYDLAFSSHGAEYHRYEFNPPVSRERLNEVESGLGVTFPPELRSFYLELGNGGCGPDAGMIQIEDLEGYRPDQKWLGCEYYDFDEDDYEETVSGLLILMDRYYAHESCMVMNGEDAGQIIALDTSSFMFVEDESLSGVYKTWLDKQIARFERIRQVIAAGGGIQDIVQHMYDHHESPPENSLIATASLLNFVFPNFPDAIQARKMERTADGGMRITIVDDARRMFDEKLDRYRAEMSGSP